MLVFLSSFVYPAGHLTIKSEQMHCRHFSLINPLVVLAVAGFMLVFGPAQTGAAGNSRAVNTDYFLYGDFIHQNNIKTVLFNQEGFELSDPLIRMGSDNHLVLRFDDLDADYKNYYYTIIHCDAHWQPSELRQFEYIEGFFDDQITEYHRSINTRVPFTHYRLEFPNRNLMPTKSGNYILKVFLDGNRNNVVLTRRFMLFEQTVSIEGYVDRANLVRYRDRRQQLSFSINTSAYHISNPYRDLRLVITQNGRWDNAITDLPPRSIRGNLLVYDYEDRLLFEGGNEYRRFDIRSLRYLSQRVQDIQSTRRHWDVYLLPDRIRAHHGYVTDSDINGRYQVITQDARNNMLESDYAWVHFHLPMEESLERGHLFVMGELTHWHFSEENKMGYNYGEQAYELSLLLKQGYYNYLYAFVEQENGVADLSLIEGSHSLTENDYTIYVYHRAPGALHDRLIGVTHMNSSIHR